MFCDADDMKRWVGHAQTTGEYSPEFLDALWKILNYVVARYRWSLDCEELYQDVMVELLERIQAIRLTDYLFCYVAQMVYFVAIDHMRRKRKHEHHELDASL